MSCYSKAVIPELLLFEFALMWSSMLWRVQEWDGSGLRYSLVQNGLLLQIDVLLQCSKSKPWLAIQLDSECFVRRLMCGCRCQRALRFFYVVRCVVSDV